MVAIYVCVTPKTLKMNTTMYVRILHTVYTDDKNTVIVSESVTVLLYPQLHLFLKIQQLDDFYTNTLMELY